MQATPLKISHKEKLSDTLLQLELSLPEPQRWQFFEGQYASLRFEAELPSRPYSIADSAGKSSARFLIRIGNKESRTERYLEHDLYEGDEVELLNIGGQTHIEALNEQTSLTFIAGGTGISQTLAFLLALKSKDDKRPVSLVYGDRILSDDRLIRELQDQLKSLNTKTITFCSDQPTKLQSTASTSILNGSVLEGCAAIKADPASAYVISGPFPMAEAIIDHLLAKGVAPEQIFSDYKDIAAQYNKGQNTDRSHGT